MQGHSSHSSLKRGDSGCRSRVQGLGFIWGLGVGFFAVRVQCLEFGVVEAWFKLLFRTRHPDALYVDSPP